MEHTPEITVHRARSPMAADGTVMYAFSPIGSQEVIVAV